MSRTRHQAKEQPEDSSEEGSFADFDENDAISLSDASQSYDSGDSPRRKKNIIEEKDSDEEELERLVLGGKATFRDQLFREDFLPDVTDSKALAASKENGMTGQEDLDDSMLFAIDTVPVSRDDKDEGNWLTKAAEKKQEGSPPAWEDSDDERLTVSLAGASRLRKLRNFEGEDIVSGTEYSERLRQQYQRLYPLPEWAKPASDKKRRRKSVAESNESGDDASGSEMDVDSDGEDVEDALPLDAFLRDANSFSAATAAGSRKRRKLRPETLDIQRTRDIPDTHKLGVSSLAFHPRHHILLSTSVSSIMYLHHVDASAHPVPNPQLTSVQVKRTDLRRAAFVGTEGEEVIFAGRRRYFHSWNLSSGLVKKVSKIQGHQKEHRTMERFRLSLDGRHMAIVSSDKKGGGMLNIVNVATMQWIAQARIDGRGGITDFAWWSDGNGLTIAGKDGQVAEWSLLMKRTVGIWRDEGSIGGTVMALGGARAGGPADIGGDRWVAVGSNSGILNIYDRNELLVQSKKGEKEKREAEIKKLPTPTRTLEQLTTAISVAAFSPDGQLLAFGSQHKKDAMRLVHLPSCTVYRNWPTEQTPLGRITALAFSADSDVLAVGNDVGKIRLWEIRG